MACYQRSLCLLEALYGISILCLKWVGNIIFNVFSYYSPVDLLAILLKPKLHIQNFEQ
jgi:hypothetical protein